MTVRRPAHSRPVSIFALLHLFAGGLTALWVVWWRPTEGDPLTFFAMGDQIALGQMPYRDFSAEYPPVALLNIFLARFLGGPSKDPFMNWFSLISLGIAIGTALAILWLARRGWGAARSRHSLDPVVVFAGLCLAGAPLVIWRFDILPAFFTALALVAFAASRPGSAGAALGLGTMSKLYPAFLIPVFVAAAVVERRVRDAVVLVVASALVVGAILAIPVLAAGTKAFSYVLYQQDRGVEIEAVTGGLALLAHVVMNTPAKIAFGFGAYQVESPLLATLALPNVIFELALVVALAGGCIFSFRRDHAAFGSVEPQTLVRYLLATVLVAMLANKVLSPQYIVWAFPFAALMPWRQSLLLLATTIVTTYLYPLSFQNLLHMQTNEVILLNVRNALLLALFVWVVWPRRSVRPELQSVAMFDIPPTTPAAIPNRNSP